MKINKQLMAAVNLDPTRDSRPERIVDLCNQIKNDRLTLPLYQRDMSWTLQKCIDLLNYQMLGKSPVSAISLNIIDDTEADIVPQVSFIEREILSNIKPGHRSVVDGQQRLTTNYKVYCNHPDVQSIVLDLGKGKFVSNNEALHENQIPAGILLNEDESVLTSYTDAHEVLKPALSPLLQLRNKMRNYRYTVNFATNLSEDEQIDWFERLNNAGSRVSIIQMRFSKLKAHGIDIYKQYTNIYRDKVQEYGYDFFKPQKTNVSYPVTALNPAYELLVFGQHTNNNFAPMSSDTREDQLCKMEPSKLQECFEITLEALDRTLQFIEDHDLVRHNRADYVNYLLGYFVFHPSITDTQEKELVAWYNSVNFTNKSNTDRRKIYTNLLNL